MWRVLSILPYLVPLMGSLAFGQDLCAPLAARRRALLSVAFAARCGLTRAAFPARSFDIFPLISWVLDVFGPMLNAYYSNSFTPFFVFFALFLAVVRNEKLPHFLRFNAMQSILLDICIMLGARPSRAQQAPCRSRRAPPALTWRLLLRAGRSRALARRRRAHHPVHAL